MKLIQLIYDLVLNDDGIFPAERFFARHKFANNETFILKLLELVKTANLSVANEFQMRGYILNVLYRCYQYKSSLKPHVEPVLT